MVVQKARGRKERDETHQKIAQTDDNRPRMCDRENRGFRDLQGKGAMTDTAWFIEDDPQSERRVAIRADISRRLRRICPHYTEEEFSELVDTMTHRQLECERRANHLWE